MYKTKYHIQYPDINNLVTDIFIKQKGYNGDVVELESCGASPLTIKWYGEGEDKFSPIKQSEARVNLLATTNFEWEEFADFYEKDYLLEIKKGGALYWIGYLIVDNYQESFIAPPYEVQISAIDFLTSLKDIEFMNEGQFIYDSLDILSILQSIFQKIGLDLPILDGIDISHQTSQFPTGVLKNTKIDCRNFIKYIYTEDQQAFNCEEVLTEILTAFGATLKQNKGRWEIYNFDNENSKYYGWDNTGDFLGTVQVNDIKYLDDNAVKIISDSAILEVEGTKNAISVTHDVSLKDFTIRGGRFYNDSWLSHTRHKYFNNSSFIRREGTTLHFDVLYNNLRFGGDMGIVKNEAKKDWIEFEVDFDRLPFSSSKLERYLDLQFYSQIKPLFNHPAGRSSDPDFIEEEYQTYLDDQINQFLDGLTWGQYFNIKIDNYTTGNVNALVDRDSVGLGNEYGNFAWTSGASYSSWLELIRPMQDFLNINKRYFVNRYSDRTDSEKAIEFKGTDYDYKQRINLYNIVPHGSVGVPVLRPYVDYLKNGDKGKMTVKISAPWFEGVKNYHTNIPVQYRVNFHGVNSYINTIDFVNSGYEVDEEISYLSSINTAAVRKMEPIKTKIGDSGILDFGSLLTKDNTPTKTWFRDGEGLPLLQHTANRIIQQYNSPSYTLRASLTSSQHLDTNTVIINPITDKSFRIHALELDDKEAVYNVELREINKPIDLTYYDAVRDNVEGSNLALLATEENRSTLYDLAFTMIACLGSKEHAFVSDNILENLLSVQAVNGSFPNYILNGSGVGTSNFETQAMVLYGLTFYASHRLQNKLLTGKALTMASKLNSFIQESYFKNSMGLGFDNLLISTVDNIIYWFALKAIDREKSNRLKTIINNQLFNGSVVYSGMTSTTDNQSKLIVSSYRLSLFAYLFTGDYSFIEHVTGYFDQGIGSGLLLGVCLFKARDYDRYKDINNDTIPLMEDNGNVLLPLSLKIILNNRIKNTLFI